MIFEVFNVLSDNVLSGENARHSEATDSVAHAHVAVSLFACLWVWNRLVQASILRFEALEYARLV